MYHHSVHDIVSTIHDTTMIAMINFVIFYHILCPRPHYIIFFLAGRRQSTCDGLQGGKVPIYGHADGVANHPNGTTETYLARVLRCAVGCVRVRAVLFGLPGGHCACGASELGRSATAACTPSPRAPVLVVVHCRRVVEVALAGRRRRPERPIRTGT